ncbi:ATP-binding cassette domain-containing protein [Actinomadura sp. LD22]|uniref:ATP-binding cassette domain-containing protein n=1 Tax=Actinomadura physcomitrii TaxID=2650748 RepID=A0A6I4ML71_9ACTN|nr:ATP-binding cassette domain-containing protein [Actinomadura physcomitrii]MWA02976.1 ATP-binding cassette domain-containing protein [Actinomadura physcomitrii]
MLELDEVGLVHNHRRTDEVVALKDLSLTAPAGQFVTVIGSNGAGKSSLVRVVSGAARPTSGRVRLCGRDMTRLPDYRRAGLVARVFDDPRAGTAPELSVEDNMALAMSRGERRTLRFALSAKRRALMRERLAELGLGLEDRLPDRVGLLSAGQRQSLTMVMAGLTRPEVLLLDEHLAALDPGTAQRVLGLTAELVRGVGCTTLMITHNMDHALALGERLLVMSRGRVVADLDQRDKRAASVADLVELIAGAGDTVSDRILLREDTPIETTKGQQ